MLRNFPPLALKQKIVGRASLRCRVSLSGELYECSVVGESPAGAGFGIAELEIAKFMRAIPRSIDDFPEDGGYVEFGNMWSPPGMEPTIITNSSFLEAPPADKISQYYPEHARRLGVEGQATIRCEVTINGKAVNCVVVGEFPQDMGFGAASVKVAGSFKLRPKTINGEPVSGGLFEETIRWSIPPRR